MVTTWVLATVLAEVSGPKVSQGSQIVVPVPGATMTCTKESDRLICVIPLQKALADGPQGSAPLASKARPYKPSPPTPAFPSPEALTQLQVAQANVKLAESLIPKATTTEEVVLAQQLLYRAKEQYRAAQALLHTVKADLQSSADPFDNQESESEPKSMVVDDVDVNGTIAREQR